MSTITFRRNAAVMPQSICDLRETVGWDRLDWYYPAAFKGYWGTVMTQESLWHGAPSSAMDCYMPC